MRNVKKRAGILLSVILFLPLLLSSVQTFAGKCTGSANCRACSNCSRCKHCAQNGGSCGACGSADNSNRVSHSYNDDHSSSAYTPSANSSNDRYSGSSVSTSDEGGYSASRNSTTSDSQNSTDKNSFSWGWFFAIVLALWIIFRGGNKK